MSFDPIDIAARFAVALDEEDYAAARALLDEQCVYTISDDTHRGPDAIVASYKDNGDAASQKFDEITYGSAVRPGDDGWIIIAFTDDLRYGEHTLHHVCEQWVKVNDAGRICRIEHHDLPGERERLAAFRKLIGQA